MDLPNRSLSNVQIELLKLFATDLSEEDLQELREQLAQFYARKSVGKANEAWKEKGLTQEDMDKWLNED
jgi:hypothetical protein